MMFYKKTYNNKKTNNKIKRQDSTDDLLEDLGNTVETVRRNSLKVIKDKIRNANFRLFRRFC